MFTKPFKALGKGDAHLAGGKGASLGEMTQAGIPVPPGFVLLAHAFEQFLKETDLGVEIDSILHTVNHQEIHTVDAASERIKSLILAAKMPDDIASEIKQEFKQLGARFVAVRSSATAEDSSEAAWAGQLDTFLNTTEAELLLNVQRCWASLFTPRAIFYRFEKELYKSKISVAVVVQKMVNSEISGIAFSVHPVTEDYNQLIIEAGLGLGEAIVSGQITPDSYVVHKARRFILDKNISTQERGLYKKPGGGNEWRAIPVAVGEKQTLTDNQILELSSAIIGIEKHYGFPCDIEWAFERGKFYITQSRPITTLSKKQKKDVWVRNASVERCGYQLMSPALGLGFKQGAEALFGERKSHYLENVFVCFEGINMEGMYFSEADLDLFVSDTLELMYAQPERIEKNHEESYKLNARLFDESRRLAAKNVRTLSDSKLAALYLEATELQERAHAHSLATTWFIDSTGGLFANKLLETAKSIVKRANAKLNPAEVFTALTTSEQLSFALQEEVESLEIVRAIQKSPAARRAFESISDFSRILDSIPSVLQKRMLAHFEKWRWVPFGYLGPAYGLDYYLSVWAGLVKENLDTAKALQTIAKRPAEVRKAKEELVRKLTLSRSELRMFEIGADVAFLKGYRKDCSYAFFYALSHILPEIAKRLSLPLTSVHMLTYREIYRLLRRELVIERGEFERRERKAILFMKDGELTVISGENAERFMREKTIKEETVSGGDGMFKGTCACAGRAKGIVKIVNQPEEMHKMQQGDIMVSHTTFPSLVPAMKKAAAIVTEDGGITCHAAIVARELGTPCVTGIKSATQVFKDGMLVEVDADNGIVRISDSQTVGNRQSDYRGSGGREFYRSLKFRKLGNWATYPLDIELWHTEHTSRYFEKTFGLFREILGICVYKKGKFELNHMYTTARFTDQLHKRIRTLTARDPKGLEKILLKFYTEREQTAKKLHALNPKDISKLTNDALIALYEKNRDLGHRIVVYDQFTWLAEEYWHPLMDEVLVNKAGLRKDTPEYTSALFALIKPREISTTLTEKRAVIDEALKLKAKKETLEASAKKLAAAFGWMPVLAYGTPWESKHYVEELQAAARQDAAKLKEEHALLTDYTKLRDRDFKSTAKRYGLTARDLQVFIDFGLAIDVRNESEYVASIAGFYVMPLYSEFMKRLSVSIEQLRTLTEDEIVSCLAGRAEARELLKKKGNVVGWFVDGETKERTVFTPKEGDSVFAYVEAQVEVANAKIEKRGITANNGKVKGTVCLVPSPDKNHKVQEGDILIAYSTMVDNLPAMKKAAAFVTESGGLTCHAAVVAREFGVPCIVSMKGAMSDFKDGDYVEVDADNGVVRLIKRK